MNRRFTILITIFMTIMFFLIFKLFNLQILNGWKYLDEVETSMIHLDETEPIRGKILDRNMKVLVKSVKVNGKVKRVYNISEGLAHVIGYTSLHRGVMGIEKEYDDILCGKKGLVLYQVNATGKKITDTLSVPPIPGYDLVLTIDSDLQLKLEALLKLTKKPSCGLVVNPKNGEILAMASFPSFNPSRIQNITQEEWKKILKDENSPLLNRTISSLYLPGSIIKLFTALTALYFGYDPKREITCTGKLMIEGEDGRVYEYKDWLKYGHGKVDMVKAIRVSCNVYFYNLGIELGIDKLSWMASKIKLADKTGIDLPEEKEGLYPSIAWKKKRYGKQWYLGDTILAAIGQGYVSLTPIQIARLYCLIVNKGKVPRLHLLKEIRNPITGELVKEVKVNSDDIIELRDDLWNVLYEGMIQVVEYKGKDLGESGTAYLAFKNFEYDVAGKTGTSEIRKGIMNSWFVGFTPVSNPKILVLILVENGGYGGHTAAPIARELIEYYYVKEKWKGKIN